MLPAELALDAALIQARVYIETGDFERAVAAGRAAVKLSQTSSDARFLLALAFERSGENTTSIIQYRRAIDLANNDPQRRLAAAAIRRISATRRMRVSGSVGLAPSTNFNKATSNDEVDLVFGTAEITSADPKGDVGATYSANAEIDGLTGVSFGVSGLLARDRSQNQISGSVSYTTSLESGHALSATALSQWVGGAHYRDRLDLSSQSQLNGSRTLTFGLEAISYANGNKQVSPYLAASNKSKPLGNTMSVVI